MFLVSFLGGVRVLEPNEKDRGVLAHLGGGGGVRLLYNEVFLARLDLALGREEYTSADDPLGKTVSDRGWVPGVYLAFSAPY